MFILFQILLTFTFVALYALVAVYAERKVSAFIQDRLGPMEVGPVGAFQTLADIIKLVIKESIIPSAANPVLFSLAPIVIFVAVFAGFAAIPFSSNLLGASIHVGLLYILAIVALDVIGILMAGWGANNKYALLGAMRAVAQIISYEIPTALVLLASIMMFGTLDLQQIALHQGIFSPEKITLWGIWDITEVGGIFAWSVVRYPHLLIAFALYFVASLAECNRAPFDIPEAESELIAGFHVEYTGFRFAIIFLAEYGKMLLVSMIAVILFFGGWNSILPNITPSFPLANWTTGEPHTLLAALWGIFWILLKGFVLVFVQMWVRWVYPRLRADQLMSLCWKYLTPAGIVLIVISGIWKLMEI